MLSLITAISYATLCLIAASNSGSPFEHETLRPGPFESARDRADGMMKPDMLPCRPEECIRSKPFRFSGPMDF